MKEYLIALNALQRNVALLEKGFECHYSTANSFIDEFAEKFKMQFGDEGDAGNVLRLLNEAKAALTAGEVNKGTELIRAANVFI